MPTGLVRPGEEGHWERAKAAVKKQYGSVEDHWGAVTHVFSKIRDAHKSGTHCSDDMLKQEINEYGRMAKTEKAVFEPNNDEVVAAVKAVAIPLAKGAIAVVTPAALEMLKADDPRQMSLFGGSREAKVKAHTRKVGGKPVQVKESKRHVEGGAAKPSSNRFGHPDHSDDPRNSVYEHEVSAARNASQQAASSGSHEAAIEAHDRAARSWRWIGGGGEEARERAEYHDRMQQEHREALGTGGVKKPQELRSPLRSMEIAKKKQRVYLDEREKHESHDHPTDAWHATEPKTHEHLASLARDAAEAHRLSANTPGHDKHTKHNLEQEARTLEAHEKMHLQRADMATKRGDRSMRLVKASTAERLGLR